MVNKQTINFNCGQLKQLIVKTINFLEALAVSLGGVRVVFSSVSRWELTNVWGLYCLTPRGINVWAGTLVLVTMSNALCGS